jgi:hypothetical protein
MVDTEINLPTGSIHKEVQSQFNNYQLLKKRPCHAVNMTSLTKYISSVVYVMLSICQRLYGVKRYRERSLSKHHLTQSHSLQLTGTNKKRSPHSTPGQGHRGGGGIVLTHSIPGARRTMLWPLYTPGKPSTQCTGGWTGLSASLAHPACIVTLY